MSHGNVDYTANTCGLARQISGFHDQSENILLQMTEGINRNGFDISPRHKKSIGYLARIAGPLYDDCWI